MLVGPTVPQLPRITAPIRVTHFHLRNALLPKCSPNNREMLSTFRIFLMTKRIPQRLQPAAPEKENCGDDASKGHRFSPSISFNATFLLYFHGRLSLAPVIVKSSLATRSLGEEEERVVRVRKREGLNVMRSKPSFSQ